MPPRGGGGGGGRLTFSMMLDLLREAGAIDDNTHRDLLSKEEQLKTRFLRAKFGAQGAKHSKEYKVFATELVDTAKLPHPEAPGRMIDEDILAQLLAQATGIPYKKIDRLELDMSLVTKTLNAGFAKRHVLLPLSQKGDILTIAICDPYDTSA